MVLLNLVGFSVYLFSEAKVIPVQRNIHIMLYMLPSSLGKFAYKKICKSTYKSLQFKPLISVWMPFLVKIILHLLYA